VLWLPLLSSLRLLRGGIAVSTCLKLENFSCQLHELHAVFWRTLHHWIPGMFDANWGCPNLGAHHGPLLELAHTNFHQHLILHQHVHHQPKLWRPLTLVLGLHNRPAPNNTAQ
jgi:hypothetical protein